MPHSLLALVLPRKRSSDRTGVPDPKFGSVIARARSRSEDQFQAELNFALAVGDSGGDKAVSGGG